MSVTRLIPANTPSQVNAEKIGVQIQLGIDSITVNYTYETVDPSDLIYLNDDGQGDLIPSNTGNIVFNLNWIDPDTGNIQASGIIAYNQGDTIVIDDKSYARLGSSSISNLYYPVSQGLVENTPLYFITEDGQGNHLENSQYTVGPELTPLGDELCIVYPMDDPIAGYGQAVDSSGQLYTLNKLTIAGGDYWTICNLNNMGYYMCFMNSTTTHTTGITAYPYNYTPGVETPKFQDFTDYTQTPPAVIPYWVWDTNGEVQYPLIVGGIATLVAPENVKVGDTVIFSTLNSISWNYNRMTVSAVESHQGHNESPNCQVEYSVDGQTWTAYPDYLTDYNNVICNIPRYMYLRFSQDVLITEE